MDAIIAFFEGIDPVVGAFYATLFTWGLTALGASLVFYQTTQPSTVGRNARFYWRGHGGG